MSSAPNLTDEPEELGTLGRYRLLASLGQGGMGTIHVALSSGIGVFKKLVVLKELRRELTKNEKFVEMFLAEAKVAAKLNHPNVIQTLEAGIEGERHFLAMEFLDGQPFSNILRRLHDNRRFPLAMRLRVLTEALAGLHYAHELCEYDGTALEIVHRDVSPQNVFVTYDGQVKVLDFGIAKARGEETLTDPGVFKGKFAYAAPEQVMGQPSDRRADVFSMGVILWEVIAGRRFAPGAPNRAAVEIRLAGAEPRIRDIAPDVEPVLAEICDRAMAVDPSGRFETADEMRSALQTFLLVSGENPDSKTLGFAVRELFTDDRTSMHRVIDAGLKEEERSHSIVRELRPSPRDADGSDDPTTVANLSLLIQSIRSEQKGERELNDIPRFRPARRAYVLAVAGVLLVGVGSFLFWTNRTDAFPPAAAPALRADPTAGVTRTTDPSPPPASADVAEAPNVAATKTTDENARPSPRSFERARARGAGSPRRSSDEIARGAPPSPETKTEAAPSPGDSVARQTVVAPRASAANHAEQAEGDDFRRVKPRGERKLDTEDPFQ
jgi:serine/threonine protein kinase